MRHHRKASVTRMHCNALGFRQAPDAPNIRLHHIDCLGVHELEKLETSILPLAQRYLDW